MSTASKLAQTQGEDLHYWAGDQTQPELKEQMMYDIPSYTVLKSMLLDGFTASRKPSLGGRTAGDTPFPTASSGPWHAETARKLSSQALS